MSYYRYDRVYESIKTNVEDAIRLRKLHGYPPSESAEAMVYLFDKIIAAAHIDADILGYMKKVHNLIRIWNQ